MKGRFSIKIDDYNQMSFGNLGENGILGDLEDVGRNLGSIIAHDVVEHSLAHRTKKYVTFEDELRAVGGVEFVRTGEFDLYIEVEVSMPAYGYRDLKPVPYIIAKHLIDGCHVDVDLIRYLIKEGNSVHNSRCAAMHVAWGYLQKKWYYNDSHGDAQHDFWFIKNNVDEIISLFNHRVYENKVSVYFDTEKMIFRTTLR
jgi:hypothetical protein